MNDLLHGGPLRSGKVVRHVELHRIVALEFERGEEGAEAHFLVEVFPALEPELCDGRGHVPVRVGPEVQLAHTPAVGALHPRVAHDHGASFAAGAVFRHDVRRQPTNVAPTDLEGALNNLPRPQGQCRRPNAVAQNG